jgi:hypothetical protein
MADRGGRRKGTPGVAYSNRTDLASDRAPQQGGVTAAAGGQASHSVSAPPMPQGMGLTPDDTASLFDPGTQGAPLTAGLASGPGPGPAPQPAANEHAMLLQYLPDFERVARREGTPPSFKALVRYLQGQ